MATKSIFKDVRVKTRQSCRKLISAIENSAQTKPIKVEYTKSVETISGEKIKEIFGEK